MSAPLWIWDIDGTVADHRHRAHHADAGDWEAFYAPELMAQDTPYEGPHRFFRNGRFRFGDHMFLTARSHTSWAPTAEWLLRHGFAASWGRGAVPVCMRQADYDGGAAEFKRLMLLQLSEVHRRPFVLVDDHEGVLDAVRGCPELAHVITFHAQDITPVLNLCAALGVLGAW